LLPGRGRKGSDIVRILKSREKENQKTLWYQWGSDSVETCSDSIINQVGKYRPVTIRAEKVTPDLMDNIHRSLGQRDYRFLLHKDHLSASHRVTPLPQQGQNNRPYSRT